MFPELCHGPDEMVSGNGRIRGHWRALMGAVGGLGHPALGERRERLLRAMAEDGPASLLPGAGSKARSPGRAGASCRLLQACCS